MTRRSRKRRPRNGPAGSSGTQNAATAVAPPREPAAESRPDPPKSRDGESLTPAATSAYDPPAVSHTTGDESKMPSFGESLRRQRELRQISLREVSEATKINLRYLESLERNDFTHLPGGAFTRGYIRSFSRYIGVDEAEMVDAYLYELARQENPEDPAYREERATDSLAQHFNVQVKDEENRRRRARLIVLTVAAIVLALILAAGSWGIYSWLTGTDGPARQSREITGP